MPASEPIRWIARGTMVLSTIIGVGPGFASEAWVQKIVFLEKGIYHAEAAQAPSAREGSRPVYRVGSSKLLRSATDIPARQGVRFGLRYMIVGTPVGAPVSVRMVTRYPNVGLLDPEARRRIFVHEYSVTEALGTLSYRDFHFDHAWEVVPGRWVFEFWQGARKLAEEDFCVVAEDRPASCADRSHTRSDARVGPFDLIQR